MRIILIDLEAFPEKKSLLMKSHIDGFGGAIEATDYISGLVYLGLLKSKNNVNIANIIIPKSSSEFKYKLRLTDEKLSMYLDKIEKPLNRRKFIYSLIYTGMDYFEDILTSKKSSEHEKDLFFSGLTPCYDLIVKDKRKSGDDDTHRKSLQSRGNTSVSIKSEVKVVKQNETYLPKSQDVDTEIADPLRVPDVTVKPIIKEANTSTDERRVSQPSSTPKIKPKPKLHIV